MSEGNNLVGVDIGTSSIKVVQLKETRKGPRLIKLGYTPLPRQTIVDGHVLNAQAVVDALTRVFTEAKIKSRDVALSISGQAVIIRKITVPMMTAAELDEQIQWEAEQHIPFDIKDVHVDYEVLRRRPEAGQMDLLLVAAKRDEVNDYVEIARQAKLRPLAVDIDAFTVQNLFSFNRGLSPDQTFAIINVGASLASINIISHGVSAFTRDIANGGNYITEQIQKQLGVPFEQAEEFKVASVMGGAPPQVAQIVESVCDSIAGEIQRSLDFFHATSGEQEMSRIFLTGGSSNLPQLLNAISRRARVGVELIPPLEKIPVEGKDVNPQMLQERAGQLCVALGLSMRKDRERRGESSLVRVNLLPVKKRAEKAAVEVGGGQRWLLAVLGVLLLETVGFFLLHSSKGAELDSKKQANAKLEGDIAGIRELVQQHESVKKELAELRAREESIAKLEAGRSGPTAVLLELAQLLSAGKGPTVDPDRMARIRKDNPLQVFNPGWDSRRLWLTAFKESERTVLLEGYARDSTDVSELAYRLKASSYFYDVKLRPGKKDASNDASMVSFGLEMKVRY